jgi:hypothetical protein
MGVTPHQNLSVRTMELYGQVDAGTLQALGIMQQMDIVNLSGERSDNVRRPVGAATVCNHYFAIFVEAVPGQASDNGLDVGSLVQCRDDDQDFSGHGSAATRGCLLNPLANAGMFFL